MKWARRVGVALVFCLWAAFSSSAPSYATVPDPAPMPTQGGTADKWRCQGVPVPEPTATTTTTPDPYPTPSDAPTETITPAPVVVVEPSPAATDTVCRVTSWATVVASPSVAPTEVVPTVPADVRVVALGDETVATVWESGWPFLFLLGALVLIAVCLFVYFLSKPPTWGARR